MAERKTAVKAPAAKTAAKAPEPEVKKPDSGMATFQMERGAYLVQPSTGIKIAFKEVKELKDDSWAELQTTAGLLKRVK